MVSSTNRVLLVVVFTLLCICTCICETVFSDKEYFHLRQGIEKETNHNTDKKSVIAKHASEHKIAKIHELNIAVTEKKRLKKAETLGADCTSEFRPKCGEDDFCVNGFCAADPCIDDSTCASHATFKMCSNGDCVDPEGIPYQENSGEDLDVESIDRPMDESSLESSTESNASPAASFKEKSKSVGADCTANPATGCGPQEFCLFRPTLEGVCSESNSFEAPVASLLECKGDVSCYVPNEVCATGRCVNPADTCPTHKSNPHKYVTPGGPAPAPGVAAPGVVAPDGSGPANWFDVPAEIDPAHYPRTGTSVSNCLAEPFVRSLYAHLKGPSCSLSASFVFQYQPGTENDVFAMLFDDACIPRQRGYAKSLIDYNFYWGLSMRATHTQFNKKSQFLKGIWNAAGDQALGKGCKAVSGPKAKIDSFLNADSMTPPLFDHLEVLFRAAPGLGPDGLPKSGLLKNKYTHGGTRNLHDLCATGCTAAYKRVLLFTPFMRDGFNYINVKLESHEMTSSYSEMFKHTLTFLDGGADNAECYEGLGKRSEEKGSYYCESRDTNFYEALLGSDANAIWRGEVKKYNDCVRGHNEYFIPSDLTTMIMRHARVVPLAAPLGGVTVLNPLNGVPLHA